MGLLDVLNGMQNGPRGQQSPTASKGGMSPITMAIIALLGYKALKSLTGQPNANPTAPGPLHDLRAYPARTRTPAGVLAIFSEAVWAARTARMRMLAAVLAIFLKAAWAACLRAARQAAS